MTQENTSERPSSPARRSRLLLVIAIVAGLTLVFLFVTQEDHRKSKSEAGAAKSTASRAVPIVTTTVKKGDIGNYIEALGTVTPVHTVTVYSRVQGQIMSVNYKEGQEVKVGDSLIEIDPRPYEATLLEAQGDLERDRGLLAEAKIDLERYRKAYRLRAIQKQLLDDQEQVVVQDEGTVKADEGALETARVNLEYCHIRSPINGRVGLRLVDPGNMVQSNSTTALAVLTQLQPITVIFSVAEDHISDIQAQAKEAAGLKVEAFDRAQQKQLATGEALTLDNQIDATTGTVRIRAMFDNKDNALFPNQFVNAKLLVNTNRDATLVATPAIQRGPQGSFVYVVDSRKTAQMRPVKVGVIEGETAEVQGLKPGEEVVTNGFDKLEEGSKVSAQNSDSPNAHQYAGTASPLPSSGAPKAP